MIKGEPKIENIKTRELTELEQKMVLDGLDALDEFFANELPPDPKGREAIRILIEKIKRGVQIDKLPPYSRHFLEIVESAGE